MRIFHGFDTLPHFRHPAATVGSYDGVHGGHMELLERVIRAATEWGGESIVLTFEPHPRITLGSSDGLRLLTTIEEKALLLERVGIDNLIVIPFDETFSRLTPYEFVRHYLIGRVGIETLVVGYNHHFGHDKQGNYDYLARLHEEFGFRVVRVAEYSPEQEKVSSTILRRLIEQGDMAHASRMLPHPYLLIGHYCGGKVTVGEPLKLLPPAGTYKVHIDGAQGVLNISREGILTLNCDLPDGQVVILFEQ